MLGDTPREFYEPGYDPTLNRLPPKRVSCLPIILLGFVILLILFGVMVYLTVNRQAAQTPRQFVAEIPTGTPTLDDWSATGTALYWQQLTPTGTPTEPPSATPTLDDWSATGTAVFLATFTATPTPSPTLDYCWFLTPTLPSPTAIYVTPDAAQLAATAFALATGTPTPTATATQAPPRAWCDVTQAPAEATEEPEATDEVGTFPTLPLIGAPETWTPAPQPPVQQPPPEVIYVTVPPEIIPVTVPPRQTVIVVTRIVNPTNPPATATASTTNTFTPTWTSSPTATLTPSQTPSATFTWTSSPTASYTASATPTATATPTFTETPTDVPTATHTPTDLPTPTWTPTWTETPTETATMEETPNV